MNRYNIDREVQLLGTLANGEVYSQTVDLSREVAQTMDRITAQDPYKYDKFHWLELYYEAVELLENAKRKIVS